MALRAGDRTICTGFWTGTKRILTARHCLEHTDGVADWAGHRLTVVRKIASQREDLGIVDVQENVLHPVARFVVRPPKPGTQIYVIGHQMSEGWWYSTGLASSEREGQLRFSAPVMPGASGGPVFDTEGRVCGVTVAIAMYPSSLIPGLAVLTPVPHMAYAVPARKALQFLRHPLQ